MTSSEQELSPAPATYADAGVDIEAGDLAVARIRNSVESTYRPEVLGGIGGFGGAFALTQAAGMRSPVLVASTDGVGTKLQVALAFGSVDTIGIDLVAMCVDDLVCVGAEPLFLLDYVATGKLDPEQIAAVVSGVAAGCRRAGCALLGGEMAEHAGLMPEGHMDIAGFAVGVVEQDDMWGADRVRPGDVLVGLPSPGLRSNGYTLARQVLLNRAGLDLEGPAWAGADVSLGHELLLPSVIYAPAVLAAGRVARGGAASGAEFTSGHEPNRGEVSRSRGVRAAAHITGGGLAGNLIRSIPDGCRAVVDRSSWAIPRIFDEIQRHGNVSEQEMERVFNMGVGMVLIVDPEAVDAVVSALRGQGEGGHSEVGHGVGGEGDGEQDEIGPGVDARVIGLVESGGREVALTGQRAPA